MSHSALWTNRVPSASTKKFYNIYKIVATFTSCNATKMLDQNLTWPWVKRCLLMRLKYVYIYMLLALYNSFSCWQCIIIQSLNQRERAQIKAVQNYFFLFMCIFPPTQLWENFESCGSTHENSSFYWKLTYTLYVARKIYSLISLQPVYLLYHWRKSLSVVLQKYLTSC